MNLAAGIMTIPIGGANKRTSRVSDTVIAAMGGKRTVEYAVEHGIADVQFSGLGIAGHCKSQSRENREF
jgi:hypothetical protein